ncbi:MAG: DUF533 domain-containing protein [Pseudomonadota bacterium]
MSLMNTLAKVAVGVALAKGAQALSQRGQSGARNGGGLLDQLQNMRVGGSGNTGGMPDLGALLGGGGGGAGGLGDILQGLGGGSSGSGPAAGGLGGLLAGMGGGQLGQLLGGAQGAGTDGFGARLNEALAGGAQSAAPTADEEAMAGLMIRAMIMAAKSDGRIDAAERENILGSLADASAQERAFIQSELDAPIDVMAFAAEVPNEPGLRRQVFATALLAIDLDSQAEAQFLNDLARALGLSQADLDAVTGQMGGGVNFG